MPTDVPDYAAGLEGDIKGIKLGLPKEYLGEGIKEVRAAFEAAVKQYESLGAEIEEVSRLTPSTAWRPTIFWPRPRPVRTSRGSTAYALRPRRGRRSVCAHCNTRGAGWRRGETPDHPRHVRVEQRLLRRVLHQGAKVRTLIKRDFDQALEKVDAPSLDRAVHGVQGR